MMDNIPSLSAISEGPSHPNSLLAQVLSTLFEPSPILISTLEPQLAITLSNRHSVTTYSELVDEAIAAINGWDTTSRSQFIAGHPRIGESKNLSSLSAREQEANHGAPTPPVVLARLVHLNSCYEVVYPNLRYITFVNGRSRAEIAMEMENLLGFEHSLSPDEPSLDNLQTEEIMGEAWRSELQRAIHDVGDIAKARLKALGVK